MRELAVGDGVIRLVLGDITAVPTDAIVNAANELLAGGGGVDGAIHRRGGPAIMDDLRRRYGGRRRCPTGHAVLSVAGDLPARWVIHAAGPVWRGGQHGEPALLASAYHTSLRVAADAGARRVTLPAISAGVYGYPLVGAAQIAVAAAAARLEADQRLEEVAFVLFSDQALAVFEGALAELAAGRSSGPAG